MRPRSTLIVFHVDGQYAASVKPDANGISAFQFSAPAAMVRAELWVNGVFCGGEFYTRDFAPRDTIALSPEVLFRQLAGMSGAA